MKLPLWVGKTHSAGIVTFDIRVQYVQSSAKRLAPHLAKFFPSTVGLSLEFVAVKKFGKELGTENHNSINRRNHNVCTYLLIRLG